MTPSAPGPAQNDFLISDTDLWLLAEGTHLRPYEVLGAHAFTHEGVAGTRFAVWAPNARRVSVVGDFNAWDGRVHPMRLRPGAGVWEAFVPAVGPGALYKFELEDAQGRLLPLKAVLDAITGGQFSPEEPGRYRGLVDALLWGGDHYMLLADYTAYVHTQAAVDALYRQPAAWCQRAIANVAGMGGFSSDRTIREYARQIWRIEPKP